MNIESDTLEQIISMQKFVKYTLGLVIISNFILIIALRLQISLTKKFTKMFNIESVKTDLNKIKTVLFLTAHPDDEAMFYVPTIKTLQKYNVKIKILCMSNGNYDGIGNIREEEFKAVSKELHMEDNKIINHPQLQDNITTMWDEKIVAEQIEKFLIDNPDVETIITFDENGVTKHPNHKSVYNGLVYYLQNNREKVKAKGLQIYTLDSYNMLFQYHSSLPLLSTFCKDYGYFTIDPRQEYRLMKIYASQFNWFRKIHVFISSYTYFNSYTKLELK